MSHTLRTALTFPIAALALLGPACSAQEPRPASAPATPTENVKPPVARFARLTFLVGSVQVQRSDNTGEDSAVLNMPIAAGTRVITADYSEAELEFEDGSVARLTPNSVVTLDVLSLESGVARTRIDVLSGLAYFELRKGAAARYEVEAGGAVASPLENLTLRVALDQPPASFAVLAGTTEVRYADAFKTVVHAGETLRLDIADSSRYFLAAHLDDESWDRWNQDRDQAASAEATSAQPRATGSPARRVMAGPTSTRTGPGMTCRGPARCGSRRKLPRTRPKLRIRLPTQPRSPLTTTGPGYGPAAGMSLRRRIPGAGHPIAAVTGPSTRGLAGPGRRMQDAADGASRALAAAASSSTAGPVRLRTVFLFRGRLPDPGAEALPLWFIRRVVRIRRVPVHARRPCALPEP